MPQTYEFTIYIDGEPTKLNWAYEQMLTVFAQLSGKIGEVNRLGGACPVPALSTPKEGAVR